MKILLTNDDGIESPILPLLIPVLSRFGEVTVVAPKVEQSGKSQAIDFRNEIEIKRTDRFGDVRAYAVDSTPADCVRFGVLGLKQRYGLVFSGINRGYNLGDDIAYSGTVGAILEGARLGIRGVALSADPNAFLESIRALDAVADYFCAKRLLERHSLYNVNLPPTVNGFAITRQGGTFYTDDFEYRGNDRYIQVGDPLEYESRDLSVDIDAVRAGRVSITPLTAARIDAAAFERLSREIP